VVSTIGALISTTIIGGGGVGVGVGVGVGGGVLGIGAF